MSAEPSQRMFTLSGAVPKRIVLTKSWAAFLSRSELTKTTRSPLRVNSAAVRGAEPA